MACGGYSPLIRAAPDSATVGKSGAAGAALHAAMGAMRIMVCMRTPYVTIQPLPRWREKESDGKAVRLAQ